ncbi:ATP-dependent RNA helicase ddx25 [Saguinus oedipus]|uniref:RNA helicase n=1 Tax=Saguinus oedipus TaxID=9490 RepID=A0ABQ9URM6_SAGOE|nr:ATP-dependent RNA helicase ddx25 [Saguinus oedipus]
MWEGFGRGPQKETPSPPPREARLLVGKGKMKTPGNPGSLPSICQRTFLSLAALFSNLNHPRNNLRVTKSTTVRNIDGSINNIEEDDEEDVVDLAANSLLNKLIRQSLVESSHHVEVLQKDPSSPLYSVKTFEELRLKEELLKGIYALGFNRPSKIQEMALPMMLAHPPQNLIAQSQSGTGKTAAFVLAMLSRVNALELFPQCLCLAPTYELALQTGRVVEQMGKFCVDVQVMYAIRGNRTLCCTALNCDLLELFASKGVLKTLFSPVRRGTDITKQIVIGTPGTVLDWCFKRKLIDLTKIRVFVLDEADVMIDTQGFSDHSIRIQSLFDSRMFLLIYSDAWLAFHGLGQEAKIQWTALTSHGTRVHTAADGSGMKCLKKSDRMLLFSATFEDSVWRFAERIIPDPNVIKLRKEELTLNNIQQYYVLCEHKKDKYQALCNIYGSITIGQAIIFCQTRQNAKWLTMEMIQDGHQVSLLTGELTVEQRASIIQRFRDGKEKVLITTNVCARVGFEHSVLDIAVVTIVGEMRGVRGESGIDVKQVTIVVNFDLPVKQGEEPDYETYLHRIGRTGRFGKKGLAFNMIEVDKLPLLMKIQDHFNSIIKQLNAEDMDEIEMIDY